MKDAMEPGSYWSLEFERGDAVSQVDLPLIIAGIESLNPYDEKNGWMTLSKYSIERKLLGFTQTGASPEGYIVEVQLKDGVCPIDIGFWKAGRMERSGSIISQSGDGRFQTFANEAIQPDEAKAIFRHFYLHFEPHPDFNWRSIQKDFE
jgi:hypothetical protein